MEANKQEIPLMFCFDNNYVIPAAVAFYSLLEHANTNYFYTLYVLHTDINYKNQKKLKETISKFSEFSELIFVDMQNKFDDLWQMISTKGHFSKEVMYKILAATIFPKYDKIVVSDVDVVFLNDISDSYISFDVKEDYYLAGVKMIGKMKWYMDQYLDRFTEEEVEKLSGFCGGYIVFNLKKLREEHMEENFVSCFQTEGYRINQMEQDVLNLCCYPKTKQLRLKYVACSYMWDEYKTEEDKKTDIWYSEEEIQEAMNYPVQLHYATSTKPWKNVECTKSEVWFSYLAKTPFLQEYLQTLSKKIALPEERILNIKDEVREELVEFVNKNLREEIKRELTFKAKINHKFGKYSWFRLAKYVVKHPLFLFQKTFYQKLYKKIKNRIDKEDFTLLIIDDIFPCENSPFRFEEYISYFKNLKKVYALATNISFLAVNEERSIQEVIEAFEKNFPEYKGRIKNRAKGEEFDLEGLRNKIAIITFLNNLCNSTYDNIEYLEEKQIPFIFTLYPGGGFVLEDERSDEVLKRACSSPYFQKVIVTQTITKDYLLKHKFCKEEQIEFLFGIVTPEVILQNKVEEKKHFGIDKDTLDICFVAHKYSPKGEDKGYDLFMETAKQLSKKYTNIQYHVIGEFTDEDIDIKEIQDKIHFYGVRASSWFNEFYKQVDIMISPTRPFLLNKGSFDGFPTGACTEAMLNEVAVISTDEIQLNTIFKQEEEIIIVKPEVNDILQKVEYLYKNPKKLQRVAIQGKEKVKKNYASKNQILPRLKLIKKTAKKYYKY